MYVVNYNSDEFKENLSKSNILIIPIGSVEAHGHHLPLGTDIFSPRLFCSKLDEKIGNEVWIAPEIPYGQSYDLSSYPGTIDVPSKVFSEYVYWVAKSFYNNGIRKIILLNGHGGNITALNLASEMLAKIGADVLTINWWLDYSKEILKVTKGQGHAGEDETSAILYYNENLVDMNKALKSTRKPLLNVKFKTRGQEIYKNAISGDATLASKDKGEKIFELLVPKIIEAIKILQSDVYYTE